jgi:hypothetical protein
MSNFSEGEKVWVTLKRHDPHARWWPAKVLQCINGFGDKPRYAVMINTPITLEDDDNIKARGAHMGKYKDIVKSFQPTGDITTYELAIIFKYTALANPYMNWNRIVFAQNVWDDLPEIIKRHFGETYENLNRIPV